MDKNKDDQSKKFTRDDFFYVRTLSGKEYMGKGHFYDMENDETEEMYRLIILYNPLELVVQYSNSLETGFSRDFMLVNPLYAVEEHVLAMATTDIEFFGTLNDTFFNKYLEITGYELEEIQFEESDEKNKKQIEKILKDNVIYFRNKDS